MLVPRQRWPALGHEPLDDDGAVGQLVLQREVVDRVDGGRLVQEAEPVRGLIEPGIQPPGEVRTLHEGHQFALEIPALCHQPVDMERAVRRPLCYIFLFLPALSVSAAALATAMDCRALQAPPPGLYRPALGGMLPSLAEQDGLRTGRLRIVPVGVPVVEFG